MRRFNVEFLRISSNLWSFSTAVFAHSTYVNTPKICNLPIHFSKFSGLSQMRSLRQPRFLFIPMDDGFL